MSLNQVCAGRECSTPGTDPAPRVVPLAFSPGAAVQPYAANLLENITKHNLKVDRIVPLHGTIAPFSELLKTQAVKTN